MKALGEVDHHLCAGHCFFEPFSGDGVDATFRRRRDDLVAAPAQNGNGLRANQASTADHDYLHGLVSFVGRRKFIIVSIRRERIRRALSWDIRQKARKPLGRRTPLGAPTVAIEALQDKVRRPRLAMGGPRSPERV
jgi:hypothetical protein